jgi:hypothetical protein
MKSGYRVEEVEDPIMKKVRYLDKLVDGPICIGLAKGKAMEKTCLPAGLEDVTLRVPGTHRGICFSNSFSRLSVSVSCSLLS